MLWIQEQLDKTQINFIDSLFEIRLKKQEKTIKLTSIEQQVIETGKSKNYFIIVLILILGLVGTGVWVLRRRK